MRKAIYQGDKYDFVSHSNVGGRRNNNVIDVRRNENIEEKLDGLKRTLPISSRLEVHRAEGVITKVNKEIHDIKEAMKGLDALILQLQENPNGHVKDMDDTKADQPIAHDGREPVQVQQEGVQKEQEVAQTKQENTREKQKGAEKGKGAEAKQDDVNTKQPDIGAQKDVKDDTFDGSDLFPGSFRPEA